MIREAKISLTLAALLLATGCIQDTLSAPASSSTVGTGSEAAIIVGVHPDRVTSNECYFSSDSNGPCRHKPCELSDWRVTFTTEYRKAGATYQYDPNTTKEYSIRSNDTALRMKLNETMRGEQPALLSWVVVSDRGCEYEHPQVVTSVEDWHNATRNT